MLRNRSHGYHPFQESFLGFSIPHGILSRGGTGLIIDEIDLYYQPLEHPAVVAFFFAIKAIIVLIGEIICMKVLNSMKKETSFLDRPIKLYIFTQMIHHPFRLFFTTTIEFIHPVSEVIGSWFCFLGRLFIIYTGQVIMYSSFFIALMRYCLLVRNEKTVQFGKDKLVKMCLLFNTGMPLLVCILDLLLRSELYVISSMNKCYGTDFKVFLLEDSTYNLMKHKFGGFEKYENNGALAVTAVVIKLFMKIAKTAIIVIMGMNITEAILYYRMFSHMSR